MGQAGRTRRREKKDKKGRIMEEELGMEMRVDGGFSMCHYGTRTG